MSIDIREAQIIVDRLIKILGKNINIIDGFGTIIASGDKNRIGNFHQGGYTAAVENKEVIINKNEIEIYKGSLPGVNIPVHHDDELIFVVGITGDPNEVKGYALIVKELVELMIQESRNERFELLKDRERRNFVREIISISSCREQDAIISRSKVIGFDVNLKRICMVFSIDNYNELIENYIKNSDAMLQGLNEEIIGCINRILCSNDVVSELYDDKFLILKTLNGSKISYKDEINQFILCLKNKLKNEMDLSIKVGVGTICNNLWDYSASFGLAERVLKIGMGKSTNEIYYSRDLAYNILLSSLGSREKDEFIRLLLERELDPKDSDLFETIKVYFKCGMVVKNTSEAMYIHRNTVIYRLNKFKEKYGLDIFNPYYCMLSYTLLLLMGF